MGEVAEAARHAGSSGSTSNGAHILHGHASLNHACFTPSDDVSVAQAIQEARSSSTPGTAAEHSWIVVLSVSAVPVYELFEDFAYSVRREPS